MVSIHMPPVSRKGVLAIAAVIDVAVDAGSRPVSAKALAARQKLPRAVSSRRCRRWCATVFSKASAGRAEELSEPPLPVPLLVGDVVRPALAEAERRFSATFARINIEAMARRAEALK